MILTECITGFWILFLMMFHSATFGEAQTNSLNEPNVPFPPACPTFQNLAAVCHHGHSRPRYPPRFFPKSGASHFRRRGNAMNRLESWYSVCCSGQVAQQSNQILCCAQQAWRKALSQFCVEEFSTMTSPYECCVERGEARWACFNTDVSNPSYNPTPGYTAPPLPQEPGFTFNPNACRR